MFRPNALCGALAAVCWPWLAAAQTQITVDFATPADYPLLKDKFNLYDTSLPSTADFDRDARQLALLNIESMRFEEGWGFGQTFTNTVGGSPDHLTFDWSLPDHWQKLVTSNDILIHWSYDYNPAPLGPKGAIPPEPQWSNVVGATWQHLKDLGDRTIVHEVWNEPDFKGFGFFDGTELQFYELYARTAKKLRELDKDAKIVGPTTAYPFWLPAFTDYVRNNKLPLDALSFHQYTRLGDNDHVAQAAAALSRYPEMATVEILLDEYHNYNPWPANGPQQSYVGATEFLYETIRLGRRPELTSLNWAQFQDPGPHTDQFIGLITSDGHIKATFNAFRLYGMMPVDSVATTVTGAPLSVMASADEHRAGIIVLNRTADAQQVGLKLSSVPFAQADVDVYPIDGQHNSWFDHAGESLTASESRKSVALTGYNWAGSVPSEGALAIIFHDGTGIEPPKAIDLSMKVVRVNRYYPSRSTSAYADFDRRTWVARLGMVNESHANKIVGVTAEGLPPVLRIQTQISGALTTVDNDSLLGVRIDYEASGAYASSVLFHGPYRGGLDLWNAVRSAPMPFGTRRQADKVIKVADFASFDVTLSDYAPLGASGRVQITYLMENTGPGTRAVIATTAEPGRVAGADAGGSTGGATGADATIGNLPEAGADSSGGAASGTGGMTEGNRAKDGPSGGASDAVSGCACSLHTANDDPGPWLLLAVALWIRRRSGADHTDGPV